VGGALPDVVRIEPLGPGNAQAWAQLFASGGCTCYCRYWHFEGTRNEWLARSSHEPEVSRDEHVARVREGSPEAGGLVALDGDTAVGWMKLVGRGVVPKLTSQRAYLSLPLGADEGVVSIGCFFLHPAHRRRGVARALVLAAEAHARAIPGARVLEAYPHHAPHPLHDEEAFMGPETLYLSCGFVRFLPEGDPAWPYPIWRKPL
jgi:GNAT superfamily N-acetyltransferase